MAVRQQKVRLHFLIGLTLAVVAFGATRAFRTYRRRQVRTEYARTEQELRRYTAELRRAEHEQLADLAMVEPGTIGRDAAALLMQVRFLVEQQRGRTTPAPTGPTEKALAAIKGNYDRLRNGLAARFPAGESFLRAYYSAVDDTFQPYSICVPKSYTGARPFPLIITLHGHMGFQPFQFRGAPSYPGAISVKPEGRGATDYMYTGEDDVLAVLEEASALYYVDRTRVYLAGSSMGATGCWNLAVHYPHLFTGIVPISGNADHRVWEQRWGWNAGASATHQDLRAFLHAAFSPISYAENLEHCHVVAVHGTGDEVVPVEHARAMVDRLRELDYAFEYLEFPKAAHGGFPGWTRDLAEARVFGKPAARRPTRFRYKTANLRHNRAWWIRLDRLGDPVRFSMVTAEAADGTARIATQNVSALTLLLDEAPAGLELVRVDGVEFPVPKVSAAGEFSLERWNGSWRPARAEGLLKRKGLSGPLSDIFRDPFVVAYGTSGDSDLHKEISRLEAERFAQDWKKHYGHEARHKADTEVTDEDIAGTNLLLFGGPAVNELSRRVSSGLPVRLEDGAVAVGKERYSGEELGVMVCYPNPLNPDRMVALVAGTTPAALYQAFDRTGLWFNWGIYDKYKWFDYAVFDSRTAGPESFLTAGFFDNQWRLAPDGGAPAGGGRAWEGDPEVSAALLPQGFPALKSALEGQGGEVVLSDVRPTDMDQYRGAVGFDRSYAGCPIRLGDETFEKGLGVKAPSSVSWILGRGFRRFSATVGLTRGFKHELSPARVAAEKVEFEVWGDGRLLSATSSLSWAEGGRSWTRIAADVSGVSVLVLTARPTSGRTWLYGACAWGAPTVSR